MRLQTALENWKKEENSLVESLRKGCSTDWAEAAMRMRDKAQANYEIEKMRIEIASRMLPTVLVMIANAELPEMSQEQQMQLVCHGASEWARALLETE